MHKSGSTTQNRQKDIFIDYFSYFASLGLLCVFVSFHFIIFIIIFLFIYFLDFTFYPKLIFPSLFLGPLQHCSPPPPHQILLHCYFLDTDRNPIDRYQ